MRDTIMFFLLAKDKGEKKLFGFAFTPLMREDGTTLSDESHELYVYKVWTHLKHTSLENKNGRNDVFPS